MQRTRSIWTLAIVSVALFMVTLDNLVVTNALVSIREDLGATLEELEWTVNAYTLSFAVFLLTGAALGDRFGRRSMFAVGVVVFTVASAAAALSSTTEALIASRALQGFGAAIVTPLTLTLLSEAFTQDRRGLALGIWSGVSGLGVALGPVVGGAVVEGFSWQWIFWLNVPIGIALAPTAIAMLRESHGPSGRLDGWGAGAGELGPVRRGARHRARAGARLDEHAGAHLDRHGAGAARGVRRLGAARPRPDAADALLSQPRLRGDERRLARDVLRQLRLDLPAGAVLPGRAGLLAVGGRAAHASVDRDADLRGADRRDPVGPDRAAAADGYRAGAAGGRAGVARRGERAERGLRRARARVRDGGIRNGAGIRPGGQRHPQLRATGRGRPGIGCDQRHPRGRRRARRGRARHGVRGRGRLRLAGRSSSKGSCPRCGSGRRCWRSGRWSRS